MKISSIANMLLWVIRKGHLSTKLRSFSHGCFPSDRTDPKKISQSERQWTKSSQFHLSWPAIKGSICDFKIGDALNLKTQLSSDNISPLSLNYEKCIVLMCVAYSKFCVANILLRRSDFEVEITIKDELGGWTPLSVLDCKIHAKISNLSFTLSVNHPIPLSLSESVLPLVLMYSLELIICVRLLFEGSSKKVTDIWTPLFSLELVISVS